MSRMKKKKSEEVNQGGGWKQEEQDEKEKVVRRKCNCQENLRPKVWSPAISGDQALWKVRATGHPITRTPSPIFASSIDCHTPFHQAIIIIIPFLQKSRLFCWSPAVVDVSFLAITRSMHWGSTPRMHF